LDTTLTVAISLGIPLLILFMMLLFGLYGRRNIGWVLMCLLWGAIGYWGATQIGAELTDASANAQVIPIFFMPLITQGWIALGVLFVLWREQWDNLIDGAIYGWSAGLGYAAVASFGFGLADGSNTLIARAFATMLVFAAASAITGLAMTQFYFRHRTDRAVILFSGLGAAIGYNALFNWLVSANSEIVVAVVYGIGGLTLMSLYIAGQLRRILIQLGIQKKRADGLLDIVIPIGVTLASEKDFQKLLETMLVEAKNFCNADGGTLYLKQNDELVFAVVRNDTLNIAMGGTSGNEVTLPPVKLYEESGRENHKNIVTHAAWMGAPVHVEDAYEDKQFDFSGTMEFDRHTGYTSASFLTLPLKDSSGEVQGVLQLLNALDSKRKTIIPFDANLQKLMESFSSLASAALEGYIQEQKLRREIQALKIEINQAKREKQVAEITDSTYFKELQKKAKRMRDKDEHPPAEAE
jgi:RsiW-degrading membrane proteinase PrsW (M82 family)